MIDTHHEGLFDDGLSASARIEPLLDAVVDFTQQSLAAGRCSLMLTAGQPPMLYIKKARGMKPDLMRETKIPVGEGVAGWVALHQRPILVRDAHDYPELQRPHSATYASDSFVCAPVLVGGKLAGVLCLADKHDRSTFDDSDLRVLTQASTSVANVLGVRWLVESLQDMSLTDLLTGLANLRYFEERVNRELARAQRYGERLSLLLLDIDRFREFNRANGYHVGNRVLRSVADCLTQTIRRSDLAVRYGGDKFAVVLPQTLDDGAVTTADRIVSKISRLHLAGIAWVPSPLSVSVGISCFPSHATDAGQLVNCADAALFAAKTNATQRVEVWQNGQAALSEARRLGIPLLVSPVEVLTSALAHLMPLDVARRLHCVPVGSERGRLSVATPRPSDRELLHTLERVTRLKVTPVFSAWAEITTALHRMSELLGKRVAADMEVARTRRRWLQITISLSPLFAGADVGRVMRELLDVCQASGAHVEAAQPYMVVVACPASARKSVLRASQEIDGLLVESIGRESAGSNQGLLGD